MEIYREKSEKREKIEKIKHTLYTIAQNQQTNTATAAGKNDSTTNIINFK